MRPFGSIIYRRMANFHGPQFDIQKGYPHQDYGTRVLINQMFENTPSTTDYDVSNKYYHRGYMFIDLPNSKHYDTNSKNWYVA